MLDLTKAKSKPMIMTAKLNLKYLKIRVDKGGKSYACCCLLHGCDLVMKPDYF